MAPIATDPGLRRATRRVAALNLGYFAVEIAVAAWIGSVSLLADSVDFLEDASLALLILVALSWSARAQAKLGMALAGVILAPGVACLVTALDKIGHPSVPDPAALSLAGAGAMVVNLACALLLSRHRHRGGSLVRAAFLSARNDVIANVAIIALGPITALYPSAWPDIVVGLCIAGLNATAAREVWTAARAEHAASVP